MLTDYLITGNKGTSSSSNNNKKATSGDNGSGVKREEGEVREKKPLTAFFLFSQ